MPELEATGGDHLAEVPDLGNCLADLENSTVHGHVDGSWLGEYW